MTKCRAGFATDSRSHCKPFAFNLKTPYCLRSVVILCSGKRRRSNRISTEQESESSNEAPIPTEEHREASSQRRSARVASKEKTKPDQKDDHGQGNDVQTAEDAGDQSARQLRRTRYSQDRTDELKAPKSKEEKRTEKRASSDSTDSDVRPSKRSKRTVRPTRCYSPSENS